MTDDGTPIEFSYSWQAAAQHPSIRFSLEALPCGTDTIAHPSRHKAMTRLISNVQPLCSTFDSSWYESLAEKITLQNDAEIVKEGMDCLHGFGNVPSPILNTLIAQRPWFSSDYIDTRSPVS